MTKKQIIIAIIVVITLAAGLGGGYTYFQKKKAAQETKEPPFIPLDQGKSVDPNRDVNAQIRIMKEGFAIDKPSGWKEFGMSMPNSIMIAREDEEIKDPEALKMNFKTYFSVAHDTKRGKNAKEQADAFKKLLSQSQKLDTLKFASEKDIKLGKLSARQITMEASQRNINFQIMTVLVPGKNDDYWIVSFNALKSGWSANQDVFTKILQSFEIR